MTTAPLRAALRARTVAVTDRRSVAELLDLLPDDAPLAMVRRGDGLVGWGEAARIELDGPARFAEAQRWWTKLCASLDVDDTLAVPGSGPVAFASFAFADSPTPSVLVVPSVVVGRRAGVTWLTTIDDVDPAPAHAARRAPAVARWSDGGVGAQHWRGAVAEAVRRIDAGLLDKVVLARDEIAVLDAPLDARVLLSRLAERYPTCWTFSVDGLVGATPELLVRREGDRAASRVLAGTVASSATAADALRRSSKDHDEHAYAVDSLVASLSRHGTVAAPAAPTVLELANVMHLASDVTAQLHSKLSALELAGALHPTAAVGGFPSEVALAVIAELEAVDRGRYAGPVGWVDSRGDGEFALALRCAQVTGSALRLWAGCGIVAGSDPDAEVAEAQAKLLPVREALG